MTCLMCGALETRRADYPFGPLEDWLTLFYFRSQASAGSPGLG
ncbi:hypothetical protein [Nocardia sp. NRRL S-836]|nr:hypothetical protein [Nocardia sp. NRRL S-836]